MEGEKREKETADGQVAIEESVVIWAVETERVLSSEES